MQSDLLVWIGPAALDLPGQHRADGWTAEQPPLRPRVTRSDGVVIEVELIAPDRVAGLIFSSMRGCSTKVSKNQLVWPRCHLGGPASAITGASGLHVPEVRSALRCGAAPLAECPAAIPPGP